MSFEDEILDNPALYDVSVVVTVEDSHPSWAIESARRRLGSSGMGYRYIARQRYEGPLNSDQKEGILRYLFNPQLAESLVENMPGFPAEMFGGEQAAKQAVSEYIRHLRETLIVKSEL